MIKIKTLVVACPFGLCIFISFSLASGLSILLKYPLKGLRNSRVITVYIPYIQSKWPFVKYFFSDFFTQLESIGNFLENKIPI